MSSKLDLPIFGRREAKGGEIRLWAFSAFLQMGGCVGRLASCLLQAAWAGWVVDEALPRLYRDS